MGFNYVVGLLRPDYLVSSFCRVSCTTTGGRLAVQKCLSLPFVNEEPFHSSANVSNSLGYRGKRLKMDVISSTFNRDRMLSLNVSS